MNFGACKRCEKKAQKPEPIKENICNSCKVLFCCRAGLINHLSSRYKFSCDVCKQSFPSCFDLMKHKQSHVEVEICASEITDTNIKKGKDDDSPHDDSSRTSAKELDMNIDSFDFEDEKIDILDEFKQLLESKDDMNPN